MKKYTVLDLFCGCGGMSWGLAQSGFQIVAGIDLWVPALETYAYNHQTAQALSLDLSQTEPTDVLRRVGKKADEIDVIVGGPPCQGFSKNTPASWRFLEDPRNQLYRSYLKFIKEIWPKVAIIENVAEIYNAFGGVVREEIIQTLEDYGYQVDVRIINMAQYGVPQKRRRCFFFASRVGTPFFPLEENQPVSAWSAISDLPVVQQGEGYDGMPYSFPWSNPYQQKMRARSEAVYNHIAKVMSPIQTERISSIGPGQAMRDMPIRLQVRSGYSGAYGRLDYQSPAPTITRWVFHIGSGRFAHPREIRGLTMREAARLQSFSDDFRFYGSRGDQAGQIGNAVPPLFMEKLGRCVQTILQDAEKESQPPASLSSATA